MRRVAGRVPGASRVDPSQEGERVMPTAAMILGIAGGSLGFAFSFDGLPLTVILMRGYTEWLVLLLAYGASIVGGCLMKSRPGLGAGLMGASILGLPLLYLFYSYVPALPVALASVLTLIGAVLGTVTHVASRPRAASRPA